MSYCSGSKEVACPCLCRTALLLLLLAVLMRVRVLLLLEAGAGRGGWASRWLVSQLLEPVCLGEEGPLPLAWVLSCPQSNHRPFPC